MTRVTSFARKRTHVQAGFTDADSPTISKGEESSHPLRKQRNFKKPSSAKGVLEHGEVSLPQEINDAESAGHRASKKRKLQKKGEYFLQHLCSKIEHLQMMVDHHPTTHVAQNRVE